MLGHIVGPYRYAPNSTPSPPRSSPHQAPKLSEPSKPRAVDALPNPTSRASSPVRRSPYRTVNSPYSDTRPRPSPTLGSRPHPAPSRPETAFSPATDYIKRSPARAGVEPYVEFVHIDRCARPAPSSPTVEFVPTVPHGHAQSYWASPTRVEAVREAERAGAQQQRSPAASYQPHTQPRTVYYDYSLQAEVQPASIYRTHRHVSPTRNSPMMTQGRISRPARSKIPSQAIARLPDEAVEFDPWSQSLETSSHMRRADSIEIETVPTSSAGKSRHSNRTKGSERASVTTRDIPESRRAVDPRPVPISTSGSVVVESIQPPILGFDFSHPQPLSGQARPSSVSSKEWEELVMVSQYLTALPGPQPILEGLLGVARSPERSASSGITRPRSGSTLSTAASSHSAMPGSEYQSPHSPRQRSPLRKTSVTVPPLNLSQIAQSPNAMESESEESASPRELSSLSSSLAKPFQQLAHSRERSDSIGTVMSDVTSIFTINESDSGQLAHERKPLPSRLIARSGSGHVPNKGYTPFHEPYPEVSELDDVHAAIQRQIVVKRKLQARKKPVPKPIPSTGQLKPAGSGVESTWVRPAVSKSRTYASRRMAADLIGFAGVDVEVLDDSDDEAENLSSGSGEFKEMLAAVAAQLGIRPDQVSAAHVESLIQALS
ncbi:hypothetical protein J8273_1891 [Carpediemonas membranifera]|uniref:Uncharacterized protein n=1 Tax=Carpediemonas membranifera TaxID=201153 RepID=A0A8J6B983_9EUKA|nr:hypothetical protein J8273_1891 [Carpediemonas membranifera]|eukprot:KAG9396844.1 hypothetical protein J8273_1891 [Carpediemonas membranifera]